MRWAGHRRNRVRTCEARGTTDAAGVAFERIRRAHEAMSFSLFRAGPLRCYRAAPMPALMPSPFTDRDLARLAAVGITPEEAGRQLEQLLKPPACIELDRPCTPGDGIESLDDSARATLARRHDEAAARGELCAFVPASGAATRMFRELIVCRHDPRPLLRSEVEADAAAGRAESKALLAFVSRLERFAFFDELARAVEARGERLDKLRPSGPWQPILAALVDADALDYDARPKALIPFHTGPDGPLTAFEEHLAEASELFRDAEDRVRLHATVAPAQLDRFHAVLARASARAASRSLRYDVGFSVQDPGTDTLAIDEDGQPFRGEDGELVLRPAGHGALLGNLARAPAPVAMVKNIDNVAAEPFRGPTLEWTRAIVGRVCELREQAHLLARRLGDPADAAAVADTRQFVREAGFETGTAAAAMERDRLRAVLDRPLRVCGMVLNTGEPGGGPFWVRGRDGRVTRQIVESAQVCHDEPAQLAIFHRATHFNPVFIACALDDAAGARHDLERFVDTEAAIVTRRSSGKHHIVALERPGLWNGGMANWNTVFVEVPLAVFNPVKTVNDLLRREHQAG